MRLGLVVHSGKPEAVQAAEQVRRWAARHDIGCHDVDVWNPADGGTRRNARHEAERAGMPDLIVTVGGDGTFLRGARVATPIGALVLGIDVGRVGFLTEVGVAHIDDALDAVLADNVRIDARLALTMRASRQLEIPQGMQALLQYGRGPILPPPPVRPEAAEEVGWGVPLDITALNDVVFEKLSRDRQVSLAVYVNGRHFASYSADALIVATSTGSTAYSFAAGGPVVSPHLDALVFTPVAPHMTFDRSLVLSARDQRVAVRVLQRSGQVAVTVDGQLRGVLDPADWLSVFAARERTRLARLDDLDFLGRVRERFNLADAAAAVADGSAPAVYDPGEPPPADMAHPGPPDLR
jgi:NAD+ kinase